MKKIKNIFEQTIIKTMVFIFSIGIISSVIFEDIFKSKKNKKKYV